MRAISRFSACMAAALAAAIAITGCGRNPTKPTFEDQKVVFGYLYVGEPISAANAIQVTRTLPVDQFYDPQKAAVNDAVVLLLRAGASAPDTLKRVSEGHYANPAVTILPSTTYQLTVRIGTQVVTATTTTPAPLTVLGGPRELPGSIQYAAVADSFPIVLSGPDPSQIIYLDAYCEEYWQQAKLVNPVGSDPYPNNEQNYGGSNGAPRHELTYFRLGDLPQSSAGYLLRFWSDLMAFYGSYRVGVFAIDTNYYQYLYRDHHETHGGIVGGIGVFGSASRRMFSLRTYE